LPLGPSPRAASTPEIPSIAWDANSETAVPPTERAWAE
jgi:hypothetical protein